MQEETPERRRDKSKNTPPVEHTVRRRAEQCVLGAMLRDRLCIPDVVRVLPKESMFGMYGHQILYRVIVDLHSDARPIDLVIVADLLRERKQIEDAGGYQYLADVFTAAPSPATAEYHAKIVLDHYLLTEAAYLGDELGATARNPNSPAAEIVGEFERRLARLAESSVHSEPTTLQAALEQQFAEIESRQHRGAAGIPTGFTDLDNILLGLQPSEFMAIAARPSVGKTALGANIAANIAAAGRSILFVSLEQSKNEISERLLSRQARVDSYKLRMGAIDSDETGALIAASEAMRPWRFHIDDAPNQTMTSIAANVRRIHRRFGLDAVFIDYLQLVTAENTRAQRYEQIGGISRRMKQLARDLKIPVVAMCQVGRDSGDGDTEAPRLHQMRESGNIEQDLDVAILLHREQKADFAANIPELLRVDVAKNRNGRRGQTVLVHQPQFGLFSNYQQGPQF